MSYALDVPCVSAQIRSRVEGYNQQVNGNAAAHHIRMVLSGDLVAGKYVWTFYDDVHQFQPLFCNPETQEFTIGYTVASPRTYDFNEALDLLFKEIEGIAGWGSLWP